MYRKLPRSPGTLAGIPRYDAFPTSRLQRVDAHAVLVDEHLGDAEQGVRVLVRRPPRRVVRQEHGQRQALSA